MSDDDEAIKRLQAQAEGEWPEGMSVDFDGPGPFELPLLGKQAALLTHNEKVVLLQLETAEKGQRIFLPISTDALPSLKALIDHAINQLGAGQKRH